MSILRFFGLIAAVLLLAACEKAIINRGYIVEPEQFKRIKIDQDDAMAVYSLLGAPTMRSSITSEDGSYSWYYVSKITEKNGFMDAVVKDQKTMIVTFNSSGVVKSVTESTYEKPVEAVADKTATGGKSKGVINETFGGLGKYMSRYKDK